MDDNLFLGHTFAYWNSLQRSIEENPKYLEQMNMLEENLKLKGIIRYYEDLIDKMNKIRERKV